MKHTTHIDFHPLNGNRLRITERYISPAVLKKLPVTVNNMILRLGPNPAAHTRRTGETVIQFCGRRLREERAPVIIDTDNVTETISNIRTALRTA